MPDATAAQFPPAITFVSWANGFTAEDLDRIKRMGRTLPLIQAEFARNANGWPLLQSGES